MSQSLVVVLGWPRGSTLHNAVLFSLVAHAGFLIAALTLPSLRPRPTMPLPTLDVVLVSPLAEQTKAEPPQAPKPTPPASKPPAPEPEPEPPEGPSVTPEDPPEKPIEKPKPKPKPVDPKPVKKPEPPAPKPAATPPARGPTDPLATQAPDEPQGPISGAAGAALEGMGTEFNWYRDAVIRALYTSWRQPFAAPMSEPLTVKVAFEINRDGSVSGVRIAEPSGSTSLDRSAFRAVLEAQLPPLPRNHGRSTQPAAFVFHLDPQSR